MKKTTIILALFAITLLGLTTAQARKTVAPNMYMFGFAASFNDTIVHFTDVQQLDSVWIESKNKFILGREAYSWQLRDYLANKCQMPERTCIVVYSDNRKKIEKKLQKMKRLYTQSKDGLKHFDIRHIDSSQFSFVTVDMSDKPQEDNRYPTSH